MRLFIAVNFDDEIKKRLLAIQSSINTQAPRGNYSRPENLHLTLIFLGETPPEQIPVICSVMEHAGTSCPPFMLDCGCTGCFRHSGKELWWIGSDDTAAGLQHLKNLHRRLSGGLQAAGIKYDERPFRPHITLGREIRPPRPIDPPITETISIPVNRISLMRSEHRNGVLVYTEIGDVGL